MNTAQLAIFTVLLFPTFCAAEIPRTVSVTAVGMVLNNSSEPAQSRQRSLIEAQKIAVEKAIGTTVKAHELVDRSILVESTIDTQTAGRIRQFQILRQWIDGIWMKTAIKAEVDLADPTEDHYDLSEQLTHLSPERMFGILTFINGSSPSDHDLRIALQNPLPSIQAFYLKLKGQAAKTIPDSLLIESVSKQLGINTDHADLNELENLFMPERSNRS
jgi:hypothetical protein